MLEKTDIVKPFDPSLIDVDIRVMNMGDILEMLNRGEIDMHPEFQRSSELWKPHQKSRLIESILLGLPLPSFYFSEYYDDKNGISKLQVIDGLQRLTTIIEFIFKQSFRLSDLQFLNQYKDYSWEKLGKVEQMNFKALKVSVNILRKGTPANVKYVIFQRVNTAGVPLTPQEMRWALNQGKATRLLLSMSKDKNFQVATCYRVSHLRMEDLDYANRFLAFYQYYNQYTEHTNLDDFLNVCLEKVNEMDSFQIEFLEGLYSNTMHVCKEIFGNDAFRKRYRVEDRRRQLSKAVFDTVSVNIARLSAQEQQMLIGKRGEVKQRMMALFNTPKFAASVSTGTSSPLAVVTRFEMVKDMFQYILSHA